MISQAMMTITFAEFVNNPHFYNELYLPKKKKTFE